MVGLIPLFAVETLESEIVDRLPGFKRRMQWFIEHRPELRNHVETETTPDSQVRRFLSLVNRRQLRKVLKYMLDEQEFLSPHGIRALSRFHQDHPYVLHMNGIEHRVDYEPADSTTGTLSSDTPSSRSLVRSVERFSPSSSLAWVWWP